MINRSTTVSLSVFDAQADQLKQNILAIGVAKVIVATSINPKFVGGNIRCGKGDRRNQHQPQVYMGSTIPGCYFWDPFLLWPWGGRKPETISRVVFKTREGHYQCEAVPWCKEARKGLTRRVEQLYSGVTPASPWVSMQSQDRITGNYKRMVIHLLC